MRYISLESTERDKLLIMITNNMINNVTFAHFWCFQEAKKLIEWKYRRLDNHKVNYTKTAILAHEKYRW